MKKIFMPMLLLTVLSCVAASAQTEKPEEIVSFVRTEHDAAWYRHQADLWEKEVRKDPNYDDAWYYWFTARRYQLIYEDADNAELNKVLKDIVKRVHKERPNSFARYILDYEASHLLNYDPEADIQDNMLKAIKMRPDFKAVYPAYTSYLYQYGTEEQLADILKRWYESGDYSYALMSFAYNCLAGMEKDGILITGGDADTFSTLMVKYGKGLFQDRIIINRSALRNPEYLEKVCKELGIGPVDPPRDWRNMDYVDKWEENLFFSIAHTSKRPLYFSSLVKPDYFKQFLYSEGFVVKYSSRKYDNLAVKRRNFEETYLLDYLKESFAPETYVASAYYINMNFIPCFKSLLDYYKSNGMKKEYAKLHDLMTGIVANSAGHTNRVDEIEYLQRYLDEIER